MATGGGDARHELRTTVAVLRLLVDGWRDGVVDAGPGTVHGDLLRRHVCTLGELVEQVAPPVEAQRRA